MIEDMSIHGLSFCSSSELVNTNMPRISPEQFPCVDWVIVAVNTLLFIRHL